MSVAAVTGFTPKGEAAAGLRELWASGHDRAIATGKGNTIDKHSGAQRTLFGFWLSPYMCQVAQVLLESDLEFSYERVSPYKGSTHSPDHKARNPLGKIPTLRDVDGVDVAESQAICRYLARQYPEARRFYPTDDPVLCAEVDAKNDFISFSIGGPFFNWFVFSGYFPKAWGLGLDEESRIFGSGSAFLINGSLLRLVAGSKMAPFLLGEQPYLPDFQLFQMLELGRTFSGIFDMPMLNLMHGNPTLGGFHAAMAQRDSSRRILESQAGELEQTKRELFDEFGKAYLKMFDKSILEKLFGHEV